MTQTVSFTAMYTTWLIEVYNLSKLVKSEFKPKLLFLKMNQYNIDVLNQ